jgi:hypothetical protein
MIPRLGKHAASAALAALLAASSGCMSYRSCAAPSPPLLAALPPRLSATGLYSDAQLSVASARARAFEPAFALWSDGAEKRRWIEVPEGAQIDASNMDDWAFPQGTKVWKEFSRAGRRLETRMLIKVGPAREDWSGASYVWRADGSDAILTPEGADDIGGSEHDAPSAAECVGCHRGRGSFVLGFSAIQLAESRVASRSTLDALVEDGILSDPPKRPIRLPGDATQRAALGYLHANCGNCHNQNRPVREGPRCYDPRREIDFWLRTDRLAAVEATPAYASSIPEYITPADPDDSRMITVVSRRGMFLHMPPLASEHVDETGVALLRRWIAGMPPVPD